MRYAKPFLLALLFATPAWAHPGHADGSGLLHGLAHPFGGLDHLLAMVAVGLWAAQAGDKARWALPGAFLLSMALGGALAIGGAYLPAVELGIAGSVVVFGLLLRLAVTLPLSVAVGLTALLGLCHGYAHGAELAVGASVWGYGLGFIAATALLHGIGLLIGHAARTPAAVGALRVGGSMIAATGAVLLGIAV